MREKLVEIFRAAIEAADPYAAVMSHVRREGETLIVDETSYDLAAFDRVVVVGAGKGTAHMAKAAEELMGDKVTDGVIVVKYGHTADLSPTSKIVQLEASHPIPDEAGAEATGRIMDLVSGADEGTLVVCLVSGGASSLLVAPADGITLDEKSATTKLLLTSGADIYEMNAVRKHLSRIKGGRLAVLAYPATLLALVISDVIGDRLDTIGSGPTVPDTTTFLDAHGVIEKYGLHESVSGKVLHYIEEGARGNIEESPKGDGEFFRKTSNFVIGGLPSSLYAASVKAVELGMDPRILTSELSGTASSAAHYLAWRVAEAKEEISMGDKPICLLSGGETTVEVTGTGQGGRNQELALAFALEVEGTPGVTILSAGTDGSDGPTDAAGAIIDGTTARVARKLGLDPNQYLDNNDSYTFFNTLDSLSRTKHHLKTGPTGTNVMDIQIIAVEAES